MERDSEQVDFYLDFTSPYAYLASTRIDALAARHGYRVVWHPFLIGATFKVTGRKAPVEHPLVREYMYHDVLRAARLIGQPLNFPDKFPILSVKPARLFYHLQDREGNQEQAIAFAHAVYRAYFVEGRDISDSAVLAELLLPFEMDTTDVDVQLKSQGLKERFRSAVDGAIERGVFGAPTFIVGDEMFWGNDRLDQLEHWLQTGGW